jgi:hypothetical protein
VRTITPALAAILRSRFQAAGDGFSGRIEVDSVTPPASSEAIDFTGLFDYGTGGVWFDGNLHTWTTVFGNGDPSVFGFSEPVNLGSFQIYWHYGGAFLHDGSAGPASGAAGPFRLEGGPTNGGPWTTVLEDADPVTTAGASYPGDFDWTYVLDAAATYRYWRLTSTDVGANNDIYELKGFTPDTEGGIVSTSYRPKRINLNRNLRMGPDQASIDLINEALPYGWGPTSIFPTNSRIRCYQWFGDPANEVLTFTGVIDKIGDDRDPLTTSLECRSMAGPILVDQTFSTTGPRAPTRTGRSGPRRTACTSTEGGRLHRRRHPRPRRLAVRRRRRRRHLVRPGRVHRRGRRELVGHARAPRGVRGVRPVGRRGRRHPPQAPRQRGRRRRRAHRRLRLRDRDRMTASPHVMSLGWETDQYDLRTRVKVRGPLTTLKNAWTEVWRTSKFHLPVGLWYDPTDSANLRVLDRGTKRLYKLRQSDRVILSSVYLGAVCAHPLGLSGDPASSTVYWVLEAPWRTTGVSTNNKILKLRKSDNVVLARGRSRTAAGPRSRCRRPTSG